MPPSPSIENAGTRVAAEVCEDLDYAIHGVEVIECARGAMNDFDFVDVAQREIRQIECTSGLVHGHSIEKHFCVIRIAAVEEERGRAAIRAAV